MNPGFTKRIIGLKDEESDAILQLLFKVGICPVRDYYKLTQASTLLYRRISRSVSSGTIGLSLSGTTALLPIQPSQTMILQAMDYAMAFGSLLLLRGLWVLMG